jgi:signal transduction histidine kinase
MHALAIGYMFEGKFDEALRYHFESLEIRESEGDTREISISLNNIGLVYFKLHNYVQALKYYQGAIDLQKEKPDPYLYAKYLTNAGLCYNQLGKSENALEYFEEAFDACGENCATEIKMEGSFGVAVSYLRLGQLDDSEKEFTRSYDIAVSSKDTRFQLENLLYLARVNIRQKEIDHAKELLNKAEAMAKTTDFNQLMIEIYGEFAAVSKESGDYENAAMYQDRYIELKDSIYTHELINNIARVESKFEERENLKIIEANRRVIERQRSLNIAIVVIAVLATLLIFVLYRSNRIKKKVNAALSEAKAIIEEQNKQLLDSNIHLNQELKEKNYDLEKANESLRRVNDELDNFIYKTSHDIRGPLASLKGMCNVALMDVQDPVALNYLKKLDITAEKLNTILTRLLIVNQINNSTLAKEKIDFNQVLHEVLLLEKKKGLPARLSIRKKIDQSIEFYSDPEFVRIILENLVDNAIKFYNDSQRIEPFVDIFIKAEAEYVRIIVVDNGIGISQAHPDKIFQMFSRASERSETGGIGLYITKTAVQKLGGSITLRTNSEGHTEFAVDLPLSTAKVIA